MNPPPRKTQRTRAYMKSHPNEVLAGLGAQTETQRWDLVPADAWRHVASYLDTRDILTLALTRKPTRRALTDFYQYAYQYRSIGDIGTDPILFDFSGLQASKRKYVHRLVLTGNSVDQSYWKTLESKSELQRTGAAIRMLKEAEVQPVAPPATIQVLIRAIQEMPNLRELHLCLSSEELGCLHDVLATLELTSLVIHICGQGPYLPESAESEALTQVIESLKGGYRRFGWVSVEMHDDLWGQLWNRLDTGRGRYALEELALVRHQETQRSRTARQDAFWRCRWPRLKKLHIYGINGHDTIVQKFLSFCGTLKDLSLEYIDGFGHQSGSREFYDMMPDLRSVRLSTRGTAFIQILLAYQSRPIESMVLCTDHLRPQSSVAWETVCAILQRKAHVKKIAFLPFDAYERDPQPDVRDPETSPLASLRFLGSCVPGIEELTIHPNYLLRDRHNILKEYCQTLQRYSTLKILRGESKDFLKEMYTAEESSKSTCWGLSPEQGRSCLADHLKRVCPTLEQIDDEFVSKPTRRPKWKIQGWMDDLIIPIDDAYRDW